MIAVTAVHVARSPRLARAVVVATTAAVAVSMTVLVPVFQATADAASPYAVTATIAVGNEAESGSIAVDSGTHRGVCDQLQRQRGDHHRHQHERRRRVGRGWFWPDRRGDRHIRRRSPCPWFSWPTTATKSISFVDTTTNTVVGKVSLGNNLPQDMAVDPSTHTLYAVGPSATGTGSLDSVVDDFHRSLNLNLPIAAAQSSASPSIPVHTRSMPQAGKTFGKSTRPPPKSRPSLLRTTLAVAANPVTHKVYVTSSNTQPTPSTRDAIGP